MNNDLALVIEIMIGVTLSFLAYWPIPVVIKENWKIQFSAGLVSLAFIVTISITDVLDSGALTPIHFVVSSLIYGGILFLIELFIYLASPKGYVTHPAVRILKTVLIVTLVVIVLGIGIAKFVAMLNF